MNRIVFAILIITVVSSITNAKYSGGSGSVNNPYLISTAEDMNQIGHDPNDWDKHFKLTADINLCAYSGTQFNRIGTDDAHPFSGVFDGNWHTIRGFTYTAENGDYIGVFGNVNAAGKIENVSLIDVNVTGRNYVGGLVGENKGTISNCYSTGYVTGGDNSVNLGGLVGDNFGGSISNCHSTVAVTGGNESSGLGGLAGGNYYEGNISNCYSTGAVTGTYYVGGLVGGNEESGTVNNCYSTGYVTGGDNSVNLGGLAGGNDGNISNCYSTGAVTGTYYVGGLVGGNYYGGNISNCYSTGAVTGTYDLGGLVGFNEDSISSSYFLVTSGPNNGLGTPLTDANMKQQSSFAGWDFVWETVNGPNDIWAICEGVSYPKLNWQFVPGDSDNDKDADFVDFARMGLKWRQADANLYCGGMDLSGDGWVDWKDMAIMCDHWLDGL